MTDEFIKSLEVKLDKHDINFEGSKLPYFGLALQSINLDAVIDFASTIRRSGHESTRNANVDTTIYQADWIDCKIHDPLCGSFDMVFPIEFADGIRWMLRIPANGHGDKFDSLAAKSLVFEARTMQLIKDRTSVPVPEVYTFDTSLANPLNVPFIMMEQLPEKPLYECWFNMKWSKARLEEFRIRFLKSLAGAMVELNQFTVDSSGSLDIDSDRIPVVVSGAKTTDSFASLSRNAEDEGPKEVGNVGEPEDRSNMQQQETDTVAENVQDPAEIDNHGANEDVRHHRWYERGPCRDPKESVSQRRPHLVLGEMLVQKAYDFIKPPQLVSGLGKILGVGVFLAEGEEHKRQRKDLMPAFAFRHIKELYPIFWNKSQELVETLISQHGKTTASDEKAETGVDVSDWARRATLDIIGVAGLGQDFNSIRDPRGELHQIYNRLFSPSRGARIIGVLGLIFPRWLVRSLPLKRNNDVEAASHAIKRNCRSLVQQARKDMHEKHDSGSNILSVAIESGGFSDEDLVNQLMTFLIAGHETTASAFSWAICMLCKYPDIQRRLREEVRASLPDPKSPASSISSTDIDNLPYLNAVCNETLRVWAPIPVTFRVAEHDTSLAGHFIPKDTIIFISPWAVNTNKELWGDDAADFKPDRWMGPGKGNTGGAESNYSYLTFFHGPRSCIGQSFAKAEFACLVAAWVGTFETSFVKDDYVVEVKTSFTPRPKDLMVKLKVLDDW